MRVELDGWLLNLKFSACHILPRFRRCNLLHGHTYIVHVAVEGEVDPKSGFLVDFVELKEKIREICSELDHQILLPKDTKEMTVTFDQKEITLNFDDKRYIFPKDNVVLLPFETVTTENLANYFVNKLLPFFRRHNISRVEVRIDEGPGQGARAKLMLTTYRSGSHLARSDRQRHQKNRKSKIRKRL